MGDGHEGIEVKHDRGNRDADDPLLGTPYRATKLLGEGGSALVYEARPRQGGRAVAVKLLRPHLLASDDAVERMRIEAEALQCLNHPNIVRVLDFGRMPSGCPYIIEERLYGRSLHKESLARGPLPVLESAEFVCQLLAGLEVVHRLGIVHRDLKLANLFLVRDKVGGARRLKLVDFGFAKVLRIECSRSRPMPLPVSTNGDLFVGTPRFAAPEQVASGYEVGPATDLYTAGLVLYSLLAGREPFHEIARATDVLMAQVQEELGSPAEHSIEPIASELEEFLRKATEKHPADRFSSATQMKAELESLCARMRPQAGWAAAPTIRQAGRMKGAGHPSESDDPHASATVRLDAEALAQLAIGEIATTPDGRMASFAAAFQEGGDGDISHPRATQPECPEPGPVHRTEVARESQSIARPSSPLATDSERPRVESGEPATEYVRPAYPLTTISAGGRVSRATISPPVAIGLGVLVALLTILSIVWHRGRCSMILYCGQSADRARPRWRGRSS